MTSLRRVGKAAGKMEWTQAGAIGVGVTVGLATLTTNDGHIASGLR